MKKFTSLLLAVILAASTAVVSMVGASALTESTEKQENTHRYYFYLPSEWKNEYYTDCCAYWWSGTKPSEQWPGTKMLATETPNVYYIDVEYYGDSNSDNVNTIIFNNGVDGGEDASLEIYNKAFQTVNIPCEYYDADESKFYPNGLDPETGFDNMIYVIDSNKFGSISGYSGKKIYAGEWYYYYGNDMYGFYPVKDAAMANDGVFGGCNHNAQDSEIPVSISSPKEHFTNLLLLYCWDFDYTPEYWYEIYTKESYDAYLAAKVKAEQLIADENTTDEEFNAAIDEFNSAHSNLVKVAPKYVTGDVNMDGVVDVMDATLIQRYLTEEEALTDEQKALADVDNDGEVGIADATILQRLIADVA